MKAENLISNHIGENLLYFMSFKESGTKSEFKKAIEHFINKHDLPSKVQNLELHYWSDYLLDDLSSLYILNLIIFIGQYLNLVKLASRLFWKSCYWSKNSRDI